MKILNPTEKLLALSWKQPYAGLMLCGKIETRTWNTNYRGWVLICASQQGYKWPQVQNISGRAQAARISTQILCSGNIFHPGKAIAIGRLIDCRPMRKEDEDKCFVQFFSDLFCHVYEDVQAIEPFRWKGKQGWSEVPLEVKSKIVLL